MKRVFVAAAMLGLLTSERIRAEHFDITLLAVGPDGISERAFADQTPPDGGLNPRSVLKARIGAEITVQFIFTNVYPHRMVGNAGVHYYVVRERELGQKPVPPLGQQDVVIEGNFSFDLKPQARIGVRQHVVIRQRGNYLLRVESQRTQRDHEHFSAIDLQIQ